MILIHNPLNTRLLMFNIFLSILFILINCLFKMNLILYLITLFFYIFLIKAYNKTILTTKLSSYIVYILLISFIIFIKFNI